LILQHFDLLADVVDLLNHILNVDLIISRLVICLSTAGLVHFLKLLSAHLSILFRLTSFIFSQVVLFHLLEKFGILRLRNLLISNTHVCVVGSDAAHRYVGHIRKCHIRLVDLQLLLFQEVKIEQLTILLPVVCCQIAVLIVTLYTFLLGYGVFEDAARGSAYVSEVING
jgi:hypothetical protein